MANRVYFSIYFTKKDQSWQPRLIFFSEVRDFDELLKYGQSGLFQYLLHQKRSIVEIHLAFFVEITEVYYIITVNLDYADINKARYYDELVKRINLTLRHIR